MQDVVGEVYIKRAARADAFDVCLRLIERQVHRVGVVTQGIDDEGVDASQGTDDLGIDATGIGDIGEIADAVAKNIECTVGDGQDGNRYTCQGECLPRGEFVHGQIGSRRTAVVVVECVIVAFFDGLDGAAQAIYRHRCVHPIVEGAQIVNATDVILVFVRQKDGMERFGAGAQQLLAHIGAGVDENVAVGCFDEGSGA